MFTRSMEMRESDLHLKDHCAEGEKIGIGTKAEALAQGKGRAWPRSLVFSSS